MDRHREAIGTFASKAREYKCEEQEVRRHEKQRYKRVAGVLFLHLEKSSGYNCHAAEFECLTAELFEIVQLVIVTVLSLTYSPPP